MIHFHVGGIIQIIVVLWDHSITTWTKLDPPPPLSAQAWTFYSPLIHVDRTVRTQKVWHTLQNRQKMLFWCFRLLLGLCRTASQPYRLSHVSVLHVHQSILLTQGPIHEILVVIAQLLGVVEKLSFSTTPKSWAIVAKISQIGPWVSRIDWCEGHQCDSKLWETLYT